MHVTIQQTGDKITPFRVDDLGLLSNGVTRILTDIGDMTILDGNIRVRDDLARLDTHPLTVANHKVSGGTSHGGIDEGVSQFCGGGHSCSKRKFQDLKVFKLEGLKV